MTPVHDLPREEAVQRAEELAQQGWTVFFKFYCGNCGERMILREPNVLYEYGECYLCNHKTKLDNVGFLLEGELKR